MMKSVLAALALALAGPLAHADQDLAREWSRTAAQLSGEVQEALSGEPLGAQIEDELAKFSVTAARLAHQSEAEDLACIFRGMAEDTEVQLDRLSQSDERLSALRRLATLLHDAEAIGLAASLKLPNNQTGTSGARVAPACSADAHGTVQYLTEQP
ncbi:MAG: hypothetical protein AAFO88_01840 [Pseudomonadota bacterium]